MIHPQVSLVLFAFFGLAAIALAVLALGLWLWKRRTPRITGGLAIASLAVAVFSCVVHPPGFEPREQARVERMRQEFAPALERYRQAHGAYPPTPEAAGVRMPETLYGPLEYYAGWSEKGNAYYSLSFGSPSMNGFSAYWDSGSREWSHVEFPD